MSKFTNHITSMIVVAVSCLLTSAKADFYQIAQPGDAISGSVPTTYLSGTTKIDIAAISDFSQVSSISNGTQSIDFSETLTKSQVPSGWSTWNNPPGTESSTPAVLFTSTSTTILTLSLQIPSTSFGFELEPNLFGFSGQVTADFVQGSTVVGSVTRTVSGISGALLFAATSYSNPFTSVVVMAPSGSGGFAMAQFRYSTTVPVPEPASIAMVAQALAAVGFYTWRKRRSTSAV